MTNVEDNTLGSHRQAGQNIQRREDATNHRKHLYAINPEKRNREIYHFPDLIINKRSSNT